MTPSELKTRVEKTGSEFFSRKSMQFFGDKISNYRVSGPIEVQTYADPKPIAVWVLERKRAVKHGLKSPAYFDCETFERVHAKQP